VKADHWQVRAQADEGQARADREIKHLADEVALLTRDRDMWREQAVKAEADAAGLEWELSNLRRDYKGACAKLGDLRERAKKAEAALEAVHTITAPWSDE
jgi:hypothetical protein